MKDDIASLQDEMDAIKREVQEAVSAITQQTTSMLTQVQQLQVEEDGEGEKKV